MFADLLLALAAPVAGFFTALWLLLLWAGGETAREADPVTEKHDRMTADDAEDPFIPMPSHLKTREEMVAWMIRDLPKLTSELPRSRT